ncbi:MAG: OmpH family outer membrane protein [Alphaproteobacteria bacterium]|nr:OmpH family outer membrane protein [Alphaproteobacteria bacterium]
MRILRVTLAACALALAPAAVPALTPAAHAAELKVAVVDFQSAINQVKDGATAKARLEGMFAEKKKQLENMESKLMTLQGEYEKQAMVLSDAARQQKEKELYELQMQYQQMYMGSEQEMQMAYAEAMEGLIGKMRGISESVAKEKGFTLVLEATEGGVVYWSDTVDITAEVVKRYDAKYGG